VTRSAGRLAVLRRSARGWRAPGAQEKKREMAEAAMGRGAAVAPSRLTLADLEYLFGCMADRPPRAAAGRRPRAADGMPGMPGMPGMAAANMAAAGRPAAGRPAAGRPAAGRPAAGRPAAGRPAAGMPAAAPGAGARSAPCPDTPCVSEVRHCKDEPDGTEFVSDSRWEMGD